MSNEIRLGLKGQFSYAIHNYSSIRAMLKHIYWELRYAWQRAWKGYDDRDVFGFDGSFRDRIIVCLEELDKTRHCLFTIPIEYYDQFDNIEKEYGVKIFSDEQTAAILQTIIFHLKMSDEDYVEKQLYSKNVYDEVESLQLKYSLSMEQLMRIESVRKQNQDMAFDLLKIFWDQLWD